MFLLPPICRLEPERLEAKSDDDDYNRFPNPITGHDVITPKAGTVDRFEKWFEAGGNGAVECPFRRNMVTYQTKLGYAPAGTVAICLWRVVVDTEHGFDSVLFFPNKKAEKGQTVGNMWAMGRWDQCKLYKPAVKSTAEAKRARYGLVLLNNLMKEGKHAFAVNALGLLVGAGDTTAVVVDGMGEGAWE